MNDAWDSVHYISLIGEASRVARSVNSERLELFSILLEGIHEDTHR